MVKYLPCFGFEKEKNTRINKEVSRVSFTGELIFLATHDLSILIYGLNDFKEIKDFNTMGFVKSMECDSKGNLLATIESTYKDCSNLQIARTYLNLNACSPSSRTKSIVAGTYVRRRRFTLTFLELLPDNETILSVELPLKESASCIAVDQLNGNVAVGLQQRVLIYASECHKGNSGQRTDADMRLILDIELNFTIKYLNIFDSYVAASSKSECQILRLVVQDEYFNQEDESTLKCLSGHATPTENVGRRASSFNAKFQQSVKVFSVDSTGTPQRSRTITRQLGRTYEEFCKGMKSPNADSTKLDSKLKVIESCNGGLKMFGIISSNNGICPKVDILFEKQLDSSSRSQSTLFTLVYIRCDLNSSHKILSALLHHVRDKTTDTVVKTYALISTRTDASLFNISQEQSHLVCFFKFSSHALQVSMTTTHLFMLGENCLEVFVNPMILDVEKNSNILSDAEQNEPMLICIRELSRRSRCSSIHSLAGRVVLLNPDSPFVDLTVLKMPPAEVEAESLMKMSALLKEEESVFQLESRAYALSNSTVF